MAQLFSASIDVSKISKDKLVKGEKGNYLNITISVNDEEDAYKNLASIYESQTKEEREAKAPRNYLGNAKLVWSSDGGSTAKQSGSTSKPAPAPEVVEDSLDPPY
jgi:hypothetical protein